MTKFEALAASYEHSALQPILYAPAQQRVLQLAQRLVPQPCRVLDIGCGTGRLLRQARRRHAAAMLVGVDVAWAMVATACAGSPPELAICHVRAAAVIPTGPPPNWPACLLSTAWWWSPASACRGSGCPTSRSSPHNNHSAHTPTSPATTGEQVAKHGCRGCSGPLAARRPAAAGSMIVRRDLADLGGNSPNLPLCRLGQGDARVISRRTRRR